MLRNIIKRLRYELLDAPRGCGRGWSSDVWDRQFQSGAWNHLYSVEELGHYMIIFGYVLHFGSARPAILDAGCGQGRLLGVLRHGGFAEYLGTDISASAVEKAAALQIPDACFQVCSFDEWHSDRLFDCIIFNESLYYATHPCDVLNAYRRNLKPGGKFIISLLDYGNHRHVWRRIAQHYDTLAADTIKNARAQRWTVKTLQPRSGHRLRS